MKIFFFDIFPSYWCLLSSVVIDERVVIDSSSAGFVVFVTSCVIDGLSAAEIVSQCPLSARLCAKREEEKEAEREEERKAPATINGPCLSSNSRR